MTEVARKLQTVARNILAERGELDLLALFLPADSPEEWDLVIGAPWAYSDELGAIEYVARKLQNVLAPAEIQKISRIAVLRGSANLSLQLGRKDSPDDVRAFGGFRYRDRDILRAYVIVLKPPRDRKARRAVG